METNLLVFSTVLWLTNSINAVTLVTAGSADIDANPCSVINLNVTSPKYKAIHVSWDLPPSSYLSNCSEHRLFMSGFIGKRINMNCNETGCLSTSRPWSTDDPLHIPCPGGTCEVFSDQLSRIGSNIRSCTKYHISMTRFIGLADKTPKWKKGKRDTRISYSESQDIMTDEQIPAAPLVGMQVLAPDNGPATGIPDVEGHNITVGWTPLTGFDKCVAFPFNVKEKHNEEGHHGDHHGAGHKEGAEGHGEQHQAAPVLSLQERQKQALQGEGAPPFADVAAAEEGDDGKRCIDKVEMVEETVYDDVVQCDHSYNKRCHTTYVTNYETQQEEECDENFRKNCFIEYQKVATNEDIKICRTPLVKDCDLEGPKVCRTVYESECWTKQEEHEVEDDVVSCTTVYEEKCEDETSGYTTSTKCSKWPKEVCTVEKKTVKKYTPNTGCTKEPREICSECLGAEECYTTTKTIVSDAPQETCSLEPQPEEGQEASHQEVVLCPQRGIWTRIN